MINIYELYSQVFIPILFSRIILSNLSSFSENYLDLANKINNCNYKQILNDYNEEYKNYIEILQNTWTNSYLIVKWLGWSLVLESYGVLEYLDNLKDYLKIKNMCNRLIEEEYGNIVKRVFEKKRKDIVEQNKSNNIIINTNGKINRYKKEDSEKIEECEEIVEYSSVDKRILKYIQKESNRIFRYNF